MRRLAATIAIAVAVAVAVAVAGCGDPGSGDAADATSPTDGPCVPAIVASTPANGAVDVDASTLDGVQLELSGDVGLGALDGFTLLADGASVAATISLESDTAIVSIVPDSGFAADTVYAVVGPCDAITFTTAP